MNLFTASCFSNQSKEAFADWARHDDAQDHFCELDGESLSRDLRLVGRWTDGDFTPAVFFVFFVCFFSLPSPR